MANRYWVGGTGNWSNSSTHWSNISGGSPDQSYLPTYLDDTVFDAASFDASGTITLDINASCNKFDCSQIDSSVWFNSAVYSLGIYSDISLNSKFTWNFSGTGYVFQSGNCNFFFNGNTLTNMNRYYIGYGAPGIYVTLQDPYYFNCWIYHNNGTLDTSSLNGYIGAYYLQSGTKTLNLRSSVVTTTIWYCHTYAANTTINAGTSKIICLTDAYPGENGLIFAGGTWYDIICKTLYVGYLGASFSAHDVSIAGGTRGPSGTGLSINGDTSLNKLYIFGQNASTNRNIIYSDSLGTTKKLYINDVSCRNIDFRDISVGGTANWDLSLIPGGVGDVGGNYGITFTTSVSCYYVNSSSNCYYSDGSSWYTSSGGSNYSRFPIVQDKTYFDASSFSRNSILYVNVPRIGTINLSNASTYDVSLFLTANTACYGDFILSNKIVPSETTTYNLNLIANNVSTYLNLVNKPNKYTLNYQPRVNTYITMLSDISTSGYISLNPGSNSVYVGTVDFNNYNCTSYLWYQGNGTNAYLRNGTFLVTGTVSYGQWFFASGNLYAENSTIILLGVTNNNGGFYGGNHSYNKVWFSGNHTGYFDILNGNNTFNELIIDAGRKFRVLTGSTQTVAKLTAIGKKDASILFSSTTAGTHNLVLTGTGYVQANNLNLSYSFATPSNKWYAGKNSSDGGNNSGWIWKSYAKYPQSF